jgi:hypothetical protein
MPLAVAMDLNAPMLMDIHAAEIISARNMLLTLLFRCHK